MFRLAECTHGVMIAYCLMQTLWDMHFPPTDIPQPMIGEPERRRGDTIFSIRSVQISRTSSNISIEAAPPMLAIEAAPPMRPRIFRSPQDIFAEDIFNQNQTLTCI